LLLRRRRASLLLVFVLLVGVPGRAAAQKPDKGKTKIAVLTLRNGPGVDAKITELVTELLVGSLQERGIKVVSSKEVETAIGFERQKRLLGCAEDTSCLAEVGGALGVDRILSGTLGKLGGSLLVTLQVINMAKGSVENRYQTRIKAAKSEEAFIDALGPAVAALFPKPSPEPPSAAATAPPHAETTPPAKASEPSPAESVAEPAARSQSEPSFAVAGRFQMMPDVTGGAGVLLAGFRPSPAWTLSAGFLVAGLNKGPLLRVSFVPWNAEGTIHPVVAIEAPVLLSASPIIGAGGSAGVEMTPTRWLAIGIEIPVLFLANAPPGMMRLYAFGATTVGLRF
jgi:TolB-like protein